MRRVFFLAALALTAACSRATSIALTVEGPAIATLALTVRLPARAPAIESVTANGAAPTLPGTLVLVLPDQAEPVDIALSATSLAGDAMTADITVDSVPHHAVAATVQLGSAGAGDLALAPDQASASDGAAPSDLAAADLRAVADLSPPVLAYDDFKRPNQALWGTATDGQAWAGATSSAFSVGNDTGLIATGSLSQNAVATLGPAAADEQLLLSGSIDDFAANNIEAGIRVQDAANFYRVMITGGNLVIRRVASGSDTNLGSTPFSANTNTAYELRAQAVGNTISARAWPASGSEPTTWQVTVTDGAYATGLCGVSATTGGTAHTNVTLFEAWRL